MMPAPRSLRRFAGAACAAIAALLIFADAQPARAAETPSPVGPAAQKKWKLVFAEEFNGTKIDEAKWTPGKSGGGFCYHGAQSVMDDANAYVDGQGHFVLKVTRDDKGVYHYHNGIRTGWKHNQVYGYVETRAKFSRQPGWWGAVWMYGTEVGPNPFAMGQEIDIFEDFYKPKKTNDFQHCLHFDAQLGQALENDKKVGDLNLDRITRISRGHKLMVDDWDAWHTIGVEWTPLEYIFYVDGKESFRKDYREVPVTNQPMHLLISGCYRDPKLSPYAGDYADGTWPDQLMVDYVRAWQEDAGERKKPEVKLTLAKPVKEVKPGEEVTFKVEGADADGKIHNLYLFTNGRLRAEATTGTASASFTLPAGKLHFSENILIAMARDNDGLIGQSEPLTLRVRGEREGQGRPFEGKPQAIPGKIVAGRYDEGGMRVAYFCNPKAEKKGAANKNRKWRPEEAIVAPSENGVDVPYRDQWMNYTVEVKQTGEYAVAPLICRPEPQRNNGNASQTERSESIALELDGKPLTEFTFSSAMTTGKKYYDFKPLPAKTVKLPAGRHVMQVRFLATGLQFGGVQVDAVK